MARVIVRCSKRRALSVEAETGDVSPSVIPAQAGIQVSPPGFRVAAYGFAQNDGRVVFVIPAKAGIQGASGWAFCFCAGAPGDEAILYH